MGYNIKQNDDGSTSLLNEADSTEVLKLDASGNVDLTAATSVDFAAGGLEVAGTAVTSTAAELNILDGVTATAAEINDVADVSARVTALTATAAVAAGRKYVELNHATVVVAATIANAANHRGLFVVKNTSASGTAAHTLTLTSGTFDGTNNVATLNAPGECLCVYFDSAGDGVIVENIGSVALS